MSTDSGSPDLATLFAKAEASAMNDPECEGEERWEITNELHAHANENVFEQAVKWCKSDQAPLRSIGADVLAQLGWEDDCPFSDRSEPALAPLLNDDTDYVLASALHAYGHLELGSTDDLSKFAKHESPSVRHAIAGCFGGREDATAHTVLIELTCDEDEDVRDWATFGLGTQCETDTPQIRDALLARLEDHSTDTRCEAMVGLAQRGDERAIPFIERELATDEVGQLAIDAAALFGDPRFLPMLESLLSCNPDEQSIVEAVAQCQPK